MPIPAAAATRVLPCLHGDMNRLTCSLAAAIQDPLSGFHSRAPSLEATGQSNCRQINHLTSRCNSLLETIPSRRIENRATCHSDKGNSMTMEQDFRFYELKDRQRAERAGHPENLALRVHRSLSWLQRAELADDLDGQFIFLWIAFNAAYGNEVNGGPSRTEQQAFADFLKNCRSPTKTDFFIKSPGTSSRKASGSSSITSTFSPVSGSGRREISMNQPGSRNSVRGKRLLTKPYQTRIRQPY